MGRIGFVGDTKLIPRIKEVLASSNNEALDAEEVADKLQRKYLYADSVSIREQRNSFSEYRRKKQGDFLRMVQDGMSRLNVTVPTDIEKPKRKRKAKWYFRAMIKKLPNGPLLSETVVTVDSDSSEADYAEYPDTNMSNQRIAALYNKSSNKPATEAAGGPEQTTVEKAKPSAKRKAVSAASTRKGLGGIQSMQINPKVPQLKARDMGGCEEQLWEMCLLSAHLKRPEVHTQLGMRPPKGFLLHGPPGCGKTALAEALAGELELPLIKVSSTELVGGISGESEEKIRHLFKSASEHAPCFVLLDEIDVIAPKRESSQRQMDHRIVAQLIASLDALNEPSTDAGRDIKDELQFADNGDITTAAAKLTSTGGVCIIGTTSHPDVIDPALRRAGRFDKEIALGIPDERARTKILQIVCGVLETITHSNSSWKRRSKDEIQAELERMIQWLNSEEPVDNDKIASLFVEMQDFHRALSVVHPSAKREGFATVPDVSWEDIGALQEVRAQLEWSILYPIKRPEAFERLAISNRPQGILLCGPPGCGKTLLAKAIANETGMNFISVKGPELLSMYVGESERAVRTVFQRARDSSPCVIFFDEIDALCPKRSTSETSGSARLVNQLLTEMDGIEARKQVFLIGATNRPDIVDPAILRPGRLDKLLFVDFPNVQDRADILRKSTKNGTKPRISPDVDFSQLAARSELEWATGADLTALIHEAGIMALKESLQQPAGGGVAVIDAILNQHFDEALKRIKLSVSPADRERYTRMRTTFGQKKA
ncbi:nuclear VCP-like protein [Aphelenchoides avenae]|nr:nuclear VCP-like protein [Aphelenchus avenae]